MPSNELSPEEQYELTYRATKNALWDVLGTAVYLAFLIVAASIGLFTLFFPAVLNLSQNPNRPVLLGAAAVGVLIFGVAGYRIYQLTR
ncbi:hypothetical protein ACFQJC_15400 [Haloferax namakaokahaiae]|uniref:Uncharacterized protein n=1 Tax=Haloferax namakaokahaiae TaxID=1748331 RepID=A0ABD5ZI16_9EURY